LFGTTKLFLDYFGLKKLEDLPPLADLADWESLRVQLNLPQVEENDVAVEGNDITALPVQPADDFEETVATEWPDPAENGDIADSELHDTDPSEDVDATVSGN
jgi:segregation and condensation protein B